MYAGEGHSVPKEDKEFSKCFTVYLSKEEHHESDNHVPAAEPA